MNIFESVLLGLIQGLTEFLPVSSSGHLILFREFLNIPLEGSLAFDVFLNTATLLAVIFCFFGELRSILRDLLSNGFSSRNKTLIYALIVGTIPAGLVGFLYGDVIENALRGGKVVALSLIFGSIVMFAADRWQRKNGLNVGRGLVVGLFQTLALIPGVSRSGISISGGILSGLSREEAIRFSFLLLIPISLGALLKVLLDIGSTDLLTSQFLNIPLFVAFVAALISGIWSVKFLIRYLSRHSFTPFIIYRLLLAGVILIFL